MTKSNNFVISEVTNVGTLRNGPMELTPILVSGSYTLFRRLNDSTYIVAFAVNTDFEKGTCTWASGDYLDGNFTRALSFFLAKLELGIEPLD